jgi:L-alanine-DL-glutamate epimerase-like enolase superfamily enzyme
MAFLDAAGKALNRPVYSLLGGAVRDRVETAARYQGENGVGGEASPEAMVARRLIVFTVIRRDGSWVR